MPDQATDSDVQIAGATKGISAFGKLCYVVEQSFAPLHRFRRTAASSTVCRTPFPWGRPLTCGGRKGLSAERKLVVFSVPPGTQDDLVGAWREDPVHWKGSS